MQVIDDDHVGAECYPARSSAHCQRTLSQSEGLCTRISSDGPVLVFPSSAKLQSTAVWTFVSLERQCAL
jgi:hypothetical protein